MARVNILKICGPVVQFYQECIFKKILLACGPVVLLETKSYSRAPSELSKREIDGGWCNLARVNIFQKKSVVLWSSSTLSVFSKKIARWLVVLWSSLKQRALQGHDVICI